MRLLLAEDDPANQLIDQSLLTRMGHSVAVVSGGEEALQRLAEAAFDAVILDCHMPGMDGFETARRIRSGAVAGLDRKIRVVALTADASRRVQEECRRAGMDACLEKPPRRDAVAKALAGVAAPAAPEPVMPIIDEQHWATMRDAAGPSGTLLAAFIELFYRDEPARIAALSPLAASRSAAELARTAHSVAGSCAMLGARQMQRAASAVERAARAEDWTLVEPALAAVAVAWKRLQRRLSEEGFPPPVT